MIAVQIAELVHPSMACSMCGSSSSEEPQGSRPVRVFAQQAEEQRRRVNRSVVAGEWRQTDGGELVVA